MTGREQARAHFPFEVISVPGDRALAAWTELRSRSGMVPVVVGSDEQLDALLQNFDPANPYDGTVDDDLKIAGDLDPFGSLLEERASDYVADFDEDAEPDEIWLGLLDALSLEEGEWPSVDDIETVSGPLLAKDISSGTVLPLCHIVLVPTDDWTTVPAHLRYGGWNENPGAAIHVAALRDWRDRYGVELIGLGADTIELRAARRPEDKDEALALAQELFLYCPDIVMQGTQTLEALAATLLVSDWWFFWWD